MGTDPRHRFEVALRSPVLVGSKDRAGWIALFHDDGFVEDPVDAGTYRGHARIGTFWDVFIAPQPKVELVIHRDFVGGSTLIRQATVRTITPAHAERVLEVPALLRYTVRGDRLESLRTVWDPRGPVAWFARQGLAGARALARQSTRMTAEAGVATALSFAGVMRAAIPAVYAQELVRLVGSGDRKAWSTRFGGTQMMLAHADDADAVFHGDATGGLAWLEPHLRRVSALRIAQQFVCGRHIGAFLTADRSEDALAVMIETEPGGQVRSLFGIWSSAQRVIG